MTPGRTKDALFAEMSKYMFGYKEEIGLLLDAAMSNTLMGFPQHVLISSAPGIGRGALVTSLAHCMQAPFCHLDASRLCNTSFAATHYQSEALSKLWISCGKDLNKLSRSIIHVEFFGDMRSAANLSYQKELVSLLKGKIVYLKDDSDTSVMHKTQFNTNHVMFVLSYCTDTTTDECGDNHGILPELINLIPTRLKLKPLTTSQHMELIREMIAGRI